MRAFVAVEITDSKILDSIKSVQNEIKTEAKAVETQNMHFTLLFLGEITEEMAAKVAERLKTIEFSPFVINFEGIGAFPKPRFARVIWVGIKEGSDELIRLAKSVEERLAVLGFKADKPFKPHATIFRIKGRALDVTEHLSSCARINFGTQHVSEIKLKRSILTPQGPIYSDLEVIHAK
ncbi:MAG: RNA 2',3'-cyclic phosphodiesterase [Candidatus Nitrosotenuis sp.]|nr:RNA 2',3'-cyclic phosphodiesterase [Candidatus Nitrosotenuis uzonensis]